MSQRAQRLLGLAVFLMPALLWLLLLVVLPHVDLLLLSIRLKRGGGALTPVN
ncbi:MAG: hypothetical protein HYY54_05135, partial [candidate division NC10 bacterium]|nr:hypothetical protein [candidate division NC10 bacterium]